MTDQPQATTESVPAEKPRRRWRWLGHGANAAGILSVLLAAGIFYLQRKDAREFMRRSTTVDLVSMRYSDRILSAEKNLNDYMLKNYELYAQTEFAENDDKKPSVQLPDAVRSDFLLIVDFYSDILTCRQSAQCEPVLVDQWFKEDICQFAEMGELIGFPQLREEYGDVIFKRLDAFKASDCKKAE